LSAFAVIYERTNTTGEPVVFDRVMQRLKHRGPDGSDMISAGSVRMGHWHFWTTPEEVGERQPLKGNGLPFTIVCDGRIDNREELFVKLNISKAEGIPLSDAALILRAYAHWGEECLTYFVGEFALVIFDEQKNELICARDPLGDRTLFYLCNDTQVVIASEPWAVTALNETKPELNDSAIAHHFAFRAPEDGQTLFSNVYELMPAHIIKIDSAIQRIWRYWQPDPHKKIRCKTDEEYTEQFLALLEESVRCRMRATSAVGVQMSGGLDSTSVASLAADILAPQPLTTISYVFDEMPGADERKYINAVKEYWNTRSIQIVCDSCWPFKEPQNWARNPSQPTGNPYWLMDSLVYQRAQEAGLRVLMTGMFGDHLYGARRDWLADFMADGRFSDAFRGLVHCIHLAGWRRIWQARYIQRVFIRVLNRFGIKRLRQTGKSADWLTAYSSALLKSESGFSEQQYGLTGEMTAQLSSSELSNANRHVVELRHPYRDRRLVEFMLAIPAHQLHRCGSSKHILRMAMKSKMPDLVRLRQEVTSFLSLFVHGQEREIKVIYDWLQDPSAKWRRFVQSAWTFKRLGIALTPAQEGPQALVIWRCLSYQAWHRSFIT